MKKKFVKGALYVFCILGLMVLPLSASATGITIVNYSFEEPVLGDGGVYYSIPGWTISGGSGGLGAGVWNPSVDQVGPGDDFLPVPDGVNVAWSNGGDISQTLGAILTVGYRYTLTVYIGGREGIYSNQQYAVILAGGNELGSYPGFNSANPAWYNATVTYTSMPGDINAGQPLMIKLMNNGSYPGQINYDKVALDARLVVTCQGFLPPFDKPLILKAKDNRAIPVKMVLRDLLGNIITDANITTPPAVNVFLGTVPASETSGYAADLVPSGLSDDGNAFRYDPVAQIWIINLATKQFKSPGTYTVTVAPGDDSYVIDGCSQTFTRQ
jgi:hypothetical protein